MKTKISKILGVGLALLVVCSLFAVFAPVKEAKAVEGTGQWLGQPLPATGDPNGNVMLAGSDVNDIAVSSDGQTIYAVNSVAAANTAAAPFALYKSIDGGQGFAGVNIAAFVPAAFGAALANAWLSCVAVSPTDANVAAVSITNGGVSACMDTVLFTTNGGVSWAAMPVFTGVATAVGSEVTDLAVGPDRAGTVFNRDYMVALADRANGAWAAADVQIIGQTAAWGTIGSAGNVVAGVYDYMACAFSYGFAGDRTVAILGANAAAAVAGAALAIVDTRTNTFVYPPPGFVTLTGGAAAVDEYSGVPGAGGADILAADIALPSDWDPTFPPGMRTYCCTASSTIANDSVYRVDFLTGWDLGVGVTNAAWRSVAYSGTVAEGKLVAGAWTLTAGTITTNVARAEDPQVVQPLWLNAVNAPTGLSATGGAMVRFDPTNRETIYVGTSGGVGDESAFSISIDNGVSFSQEALVDQGAGLNTLVAIQTMALTPLDAATVFVGSNDGAQLGVWKSATPVAPTSWSRVFCVTAAGPGLLAVNPGYDTAPAVIFTNTVLGGRMYVSQDGGATWAARWAPLVTAAVAAVAMEDATTVYAAQGLTVYKSTNACWGFGPPVAANVGAIISLDAATSGLLLVGGTGACAFSTDGGATFVPIAIGLAPAGTYVITADSGYGGGGPATNYVYAADTSIALGLTYRFDITTGGGGSWANLGAAPTAGNFPMGIASNNGALYSMDNGAGAADECNRTLIPFLEPGVVAVIGWSAMNTFAPATAANITSFAAVANHLYAAAGATPAVWAYDDYLATELPNPTNPTINVDVDPVTGRADPVTITWAAMGTGTGLVNQYMIQIAEAGTNFATARATQYNVLGAVGPPVILGGLDPTNPNIVVHVNGQWAINLQAGTTFEYRIQARTEVGGDAVVSGWSATGTIVVAEGLPQTEMVPPLEVPPITVPPIEVPPVTVPPAQVVSPAWIWAVVIIGAILVIVVIFLIWKTRGPR